MSIELGERMPTSQGGQPLMGGADAVRKTKEMIEPSDVFLHEKTQKLFKYASRGEYMSKKSENVYPEIWGILKLSGLINQKFFETVLLKF